MPLKCAIANCSNNGRNIRISDVTFHRFPLKNKSLVEKWTKCCQRKVNPRSARICSIHFYSSDYEDDLKNRLLELPEKKRLKPTAVPRLKLPTPRKKYKYNWADARVAIKREKRKELLRAKDSSIHFEVVDVEEDGVEEDGVEEDSVEEDGVEEVDVEKVDETSVPNINLPTQTDDHSLSNGRKERKCKKKEPLFYAEDFIDPEEIQDHYRKLKNRVCRLEKIVKRLNKKVKLLTKERKKNGKLRKRRKKLLKSLKKKSKLPKPDSEWGLDEEMAMGTETPPYMVVETDQKIFITPDIVPSDLSAAGPSTQMEPDSSLTEQDVFLALNSEMYPAYDPQPITLTKFKEEPIDPDEHNQVDLSAPVVQEWRSILKPVSSVNSGPCHVLIKEEPVDYEEL